MKKLLFLLLFPGVANAYSTTYNPFTGKLDYVGISTGAVVGQVILNRNTLQSGATFYVSSGTVDQGGLTVYGTLDVNRPDKNAGVGNAGRLQFNPAAQTNLILTNENLIGSSNLISFNDSSNNNYAQIQMGGQGGTGAFSIYHSSCTGVSPSCLPQLRWSADPVTTQVFYDHVGATILTLDTPGSVLTSSITFNGQVNISSYVKLSGASGTSGQVLTSGGANTVPTWTTPAAGGGSSTLAVGTGTAAGFTVPGTSPTAVINLNSAQFSAALAGSATAYISILTSSITALGSDIDLSGSEVSGTLAAARMPALTGDVTTSAGAVATTAAALQANIKTFSSSVTVTNAAGLNVTTQIIASSASLVNVYVSSNSILANTTFYRDGTTIMGPTTVAAVENDFLLRVSSANATSLLEVRNNGHLVSSGTVPSVSSCGTSPTIDNNSTDLAGKINVGSVTATSCTLTFASAFLNAPACVISSDSTAVTADVSSVSTTAAVFGFSVSLAGGHVWYVCIGSKG